MTYTLIIIIVTAIISYSAFNNDSLYNKLIMWPNRMNTPGEYYRLLTSGFIHADWAHLIFNMLTLFFFGQSVENAFAYYGMSKILFLVLYLAGIIVASLPSFMKHKNDSFYRSLGASGGVAAVLFSYIYFSPWQIIYVFFLPIPGIVAGVGYLIYAAYMSRKGRDAVNHDAHFYGALFGFVFTLLFAPDHGKMFLYQLLHPSF